MRVPLSERSDVYAFVQGEDGACVLNLPARLSSHQIKLRNQDIEFFEYGGEYPSQFLYLKSRLMSPDQQDYQRQKNFDDTLCKLPTIDLAGYGPTIEEFQRLLFNTNRRIEGFEIVKARS
jgi:hypothetical protein